MLRKQLGVEIGMSPRMELVLVVPMAMTVKAVWARISRDSTTTKRLFDDHSNIVPVHAKYERVYPLARSLSDHQAARADCRESRQHGFIVLDIGPRTLGDTTSAQESKFLPCLPHSPLLKPVAVNDWYASRLRSSSKQVLPRHLRDLSKFLCISPRKHPANSEPRRVNPSPLLSVHG